ncbi:MAG: hypothetical protein RIR26_1434 [Pseudomonadota bacterium]
MNIVVAGGTGLVGRELLRLLSEKKEVRVLALVRQIPSSLAAMENVSFRSFDFDSDAEYEWLSNQPCDVAYCCLGSTRRKAGSRASFYKVDYEYPARLFAALQKQKPRVCLVSSVGADHPRGFYLQTKAALEEHLRNSGLPFILLRPSLLLGKRDEFRFFEGLARVLIEPVHTLLRHSSLPSAWRKYAPVRASEVAQAMVRATLDKSREQRPRILEGEDLWRESSV